MYYKTNEKKKAVGPNEVSMELWETSGDVSIGWLKRFFNKVLAEGKIVEAWFKSFVVSIFKAKQYLQNMEIIEA